MIRYAGIFSAHARGRWALTGRGLHDAAPRISSPSKNESLPPRPERIRPGELQLPIIELPNDPGRTRRLDWAMLLKRVFAVDVLSCPRCQSRMRLRAFIDDERIARTILVHLGLSPRPRARPRAPSQLDLVIDYDAVDPPLLLD